MARYFTPERDHYGEREDGRAYVIAHKGVPIAVAQAERLGVIPAEGAAEEQLSEIEESGRPRRSVRSTPPVASAKPTDAASTEANGQQAANTRARGASNKGKGKGKQETKEPETNGPESKEAEPKDSDGGNQEGGGEGQPTAS